MIELPDASRRRLIAGLSGVVLAAGSAGAALHFDEHQLSANNALEMRSLFSF